MLRTRQLLSRALEYTKSHKKQAIICVSLLVLAIYGLVFFVEKPVHFSYAETTCIRHLSLLPDIHKSGEKDRFQLTYKDEFKMGNVSLASLSTCFTPVAAPEEGVAKVSAAPFGGLIARKTFAVTIPAAPRASFADIKKAVPVGKPLELALSTPDTVYRYTLTVAKETAECTSDSEELRCDVQKLGLAQGKEYTFTLKRTFEDKTTVVVSKKLTTLKATKVTKSSVTNRQTVYSKPKAFEFRLDKSIKTASVTLKSGKKKIPVSVTPKGKSVRATITKDLERSKTFTLVLDKVEADDGSTLDTPYSVTFMTSGGPKITGVSAGQSGVGSSDTIVLQFDQPLASTTDIAKMIKLTGGSYSVTFQGAQAYVRLQNLPKCQAFTISAAPGLTSAYGIKSTDGWSFSSKTLCYTLSVYGYSRQGRPLYAYYFGNGGTTTLYVGAIHGSEPSSKYLLDDWVNELEANSGRIPSGSQVVVVPSINPDGVAAGTRNNANNVNLNRNFPTSDWQKDINDTNGPVPGGGGSAPLSEPEAKALANLSLSLRPRLTLSYHAVGSMVIGDPGGYSAGYAARYAAMVGYSDNTNAGSSSFDYSITGAFEDWSYRNAGLPSMTIELGSYYYHNFPAHREAFWAMLR